MAARRTSSGDGASGSGDGASGSGGIGANGPGGIGASGSGVGGMGPGAVRLTDGKGKKEKQPENDLEVLQKHLHALAILPNRNLSWLEPCEKFLPHDASTLVCNWTPEAT